MRITDTFTDTKANYWTLPKLGEPVEQLFDTTTSLLEQKKPINLTNKPDMASSSMDPNEKLTLTTTNRELKLALYPAVPSLLSFDSLCYLFIYLVDNHLKYYDMLDITFDLLRYCKLLTGRFIKQENKQLEQLRRLIWKISLLSLLNFVYIFLVL